MAMGPVGDTLGSGYLLCVCVCVCVLCSFKSVRHAE